MKPRILILLSCFVLCCGQQCGAPPPITEPAPIAQEASRGIPEGIYIGSLSCTETSNLAVVGMAPTVGDSETTELPWLETFGSDGVPLALDGSAIAPGYDNAPLLPEMSLVVQSVVVSEGRVDVTYDETLELNTTLDPPMTLTGTQAETFILQGDGTVFMQRSKHLRGEEFDASVQHTLVFTTDAECSGILY